MYVPADGLSIWEKANGEFSLPALPSVCTIEPIGVDPLYNCNLDQ